MKTLEKEQSGKLNVDQLVQTTSLLSSSRQQTKHDKPKRLMQKLGELCTIMDVTDICSGPSLYRALP